MLAELNNTIAQIALNAVESTKPVGVYHGLVTSVSPLQIQLDQKITLGAEYLELGTLVSDVELKAMLPITTGNAPVGEGVEAAVQWMIAVANDSSHGYSQSSRWGTPDYDCSSFTITAFKRAGFNVGAATYTGNMRSVFSNAGFLVLSAGTAKQRGDILLNDANHVAVHIGGQASSNEFGGVTGGRPGDQTGREINISSYYNYPWNCVLRWPGGMGGGGSSGDSTSLQEATIKLKWALKTNEKVVLLRVQGGQKYVVIDRVR